MGGAQRRKTGALTVRIKSFLIFLLSASVLLGCQKPAPTATELTFEQIRVIEPYLAANVGATAFGGVVFCAYQTMAIEPAGETTRVYLWAHCQEYYQGQSGLEKGSGVSASVAVTLQPSESGVAVLKHQMPRDGSFGEEDVRAIFPQSTWPQIFPVGEEGIRAYNARAALLEGEAEGKALVHFASSPISTP